MRRRCLSTAAQPVLGAVYRAHGAPHHVLNIESLPPLAPPGPGHVLLRMLAAPVNPSDLNQIEGKYPVQPALPAVGGNEGVAEVQAVGPGVQHLSPGDWVLPPAGGGFGTWRSHALAPASTLRPCPPGLPVEAAATLSVNPVTALRLLDDFAALQPGDVVVQNAANSAVGRAVIQMGCARGLRVACIVRDRDGADAVIAELLALGAAAAVRSGHSRSDPVMACLPPGALGLNAVGGPSAGEVARLLRPGAKLVTYGGMSKQPVMLPTAAFIFRDLVACGFWLTSWSRSVSEADMGAALEACAALVRRGQLRVGPMSAVRGLEALPEALRSAAEGDATHKVLVRMD